MTEMINTYHSTKAAPRWLELTVLPIWSFCELNVVACTLRENLCTPYSGRFSRAHEDSSHTCCLTLKVMRSQVSRLTAHT